MTEAEIDSYTSIIGKFMGVVEPDSTGKRYIAKGRRVK